jgi:hypothetical protein
MTVEDMKDVYGLKVLLPVSQTLGVGNFKDIVAATAVEVVPVASVAQGTQTTT